MIKIDGIEKEKSTFIKIIEYFYSGFLSLGVIFILVALWKFGSLKAGEFMLPNPKTVFNASFEIIKNYNANEIDITFFRFLSGFFISSFIGISLGLIAGYFKSMRAFLSPIISILLSMPPIIWIVMALFWFGFKDTSTLFTIIIVTTPLTFANSMLGMISVNESIKEVFDAYKLGIVKKIRFLYLPHLLPFLLASLSIAVATAVKITIMAELLGSNSGIGAKIADSRVMLDTVNVMAFVVIVLTFSGAVEYLILKPLEILFLPWKKRS